MVKVMVVLNMNINLFQTDAGEVVCLCVNEQQCMRFAVKCI